MALVESSVVGMSHRGVGVSPASEADRVVVWLRDEHDVSTQGVLSHALASLIADNEGDLVVDLSGVAFMDAAAVGVLCQARELLRLRSRSLVLRSPSPSARRILDLCGVAERSGSCGVVP